MSIWVYWPVYKRQRIAAENEKAHIQKRLELAKAKLHAVTGHIVV